ncbi:MAG: PKD domain-containing protein [Candidatus Kapaibacterium sp.]
MPYTTKTRLSYSILDMSDGIGQIISRDNLVIEDYLTEGMTGTIHSNGHDFWVVVYRYNQPAFISIPVNKLGVNNLNIVTSLANDLTPSSFIGHYYNMLKISPDSKKMLDIWQKFTLRDFNNTTGEITNSTTIGDITLAFSFSPDNSKIYCIRGGEVGSALNSGRLYQISLLDPTLTAIPIDTSINIWYRFSGSLQNAPDGKIYFISSPKNGNSPIWNLSCIEEPNKKGDSCKLLIQKLRLKDYIKGKEYAETQFPNYMDYIFNTDGALGAEQLAARCSPPKALVLPDSGCIGSTLVFTDLSKYATRRAWKFENGLPGTSSDSIVSVTYSKAGTYKVILTVENDNGSASDTTYAIVYPNPTANAGTDKTICPNSSAQLGDKPEVGNTYSWLPTADLDNPSISNPNASPKTTTQYILTVTSEHGCIAYDTVLVTVGNIVAKVSNDTTICSGSSIQLLASGGAKYIWTPSTGLSDTTIENPIATPTKTTTYKVLISSGTCEDSAFVTITVNPQPTAKAGQDKTLCIGASTEIGEAAQAGYSYNWQPTAGLDDATKANPTASPTSTTQYILTVTGNGGCTAIDTVLVTIGTIKAIVSNDTSICEGASAKLSASGGSKYEWSPSAGLDNTSIANPTANPTSTTKYMVLVSSGTCIDSAFVTVTILPPPNANAGEDKSICIGESVEIGTPAEPGNSYSWSPTTGLTSPTTSQTIASPATTTTYTLQVTNPAGCVKSDEVIVTVNPRNARSFTLQPDTVSILPGKQFTANLEIPSGVADWSVKLNYDPLLMKYNSIANSQAIPDDLKGELIVSGTGGSRSIPITFDAYLPHTSDSIYPVKLSVDTSKIAECETWSSTGNILMLADYCGKNIRVVSSTGKMYFLTVKDKSIDFGVGLSGNVRLEVFDYVGNSVLVVSDGALEAGEYSAALDLPVGVYYCRMSAGMFQGVGKVMIAR